ncbi:MAG TPA: transcriptional regulator [Chryseobacterium sp.]|nr:transcriptional regulator [Chryseobacterium sp.]
MDLKQKVGERITFLRKKKELSQQQFSYVADMERTYLSHIEKGRKNISLSTLEKILGALDVTPNEFFNTKDFK